MKQILFPVILVIVLTIGAIFLDFYITSECDALIVEASGGNGSSAFQHHWESFSKIAAFITPYELVRTGDANCRNYIALMEADAAVADVDAARDVMISSIQQIRRIHSLDWELIL